jgi:nitroimidazol reductase NimA-like FMN-containing flavoprotein (pyridoxamine 5'-phosphate oxidase superfamily)
MREVDQWGAEVIHRQECLHLLEQDRVGRVGVSDHGAPLILPVNYVLDGDAVVFRTAPGTKLQAALRAPVAFEVDQIDRATRSGWSVVVRGVAEEVTSFSGLGLVQRLESVSLEPWAPGEKGCLVRIIPRSITGRRIGGSCAESERPPRA